MATAPYKNGDRWRVAIELPPGPDGKRRRHIVSAPTRKALEDMLAERRGLRRSGLTFGDYANRWVQGASGRTREKRAWKVSHAIESFGPILIEDVTGPMVRDLLLDHAELASVNEIKAGASAALRLAMADGVLDRDVAEAVDLPSRSAQPSIDLEAGTIYFWRDPKNRRSIRRLNLPSMSRRIVAGNHEAVGSPEDGPVWPCSMDRFSLRKRLAALSTKAELGRNSTYDLRHTAATRMARDGVPILQLQMIMGHSSTAMLPQIYVHAEDTITVPGFAGA